PLLVFPTDRGIRSFCCVIDFCSSKIRKYRIFITLYFGMGFPAWAQTANLGLASATAARGTNVSLNISLNTTVLSPAAVQWTLGYQMSDVSSISVSPGPAATAAGKSLICNPLAGSVACVIYGANSTAIANGTLGVVTLGISPTTTNSSTTISLTNSM